MNNDEWLRAEQAHQIKMESAKFDRLRLEQKHKEAMAQERSTRVGYVAAALATVAVILGIGYFVWDGNTQASERYRDVQVVCIENGGTWTSVGGSIPACYRFTPEQVD